MEPDSLFGRALFYFGQYPRVLGTLRDSWSAGRHSTQSGNETLLSTTFTGAGSNVQSLTSSLVASMLFSTVQLWKEVSNRQLAQPDFEHSPIKTPLQAGKHL